MLVTRLFHYVKLDMGLIKNIDQTPSAQALVRSTIDYCHQNQLLVIAEGIETESEYNTVKDLGADLYRASSWQNLPLLYTSPDKSIKLAAPIIPASLPSTAQRTGGTNALSPPKHRKLRCSSTAFVR